MLLDLTVLDDEEPVDFDCWYLTKAYRYRDYFKAMCWGLGPGGYLCMLNLGHECWHANIYIREKWRVL